MKYNVSVIKRITFLIMTMALAVAMVACQGAVGPAGGKGDKGDKGDQGDPGMDGTDGVDGTPGQTGDPGKDPLSAMTGKGGPASTIECDPGDPIRTLGVQFLAGQRDRYT